MKTVFQCLLLTVVMGCASKSKPAADHPADVAMPACTPEECSQLPEPPISPLACGEGHESQIGTTCTRVPNDGCRKVLTCDGKPLQ